MAEAGRPTKMTDTIIAKLEEGFIKGLTDREACLYANIDPSTLYRYCEEHNDFTTRKELLKESPKIKAKFNLNNEILNGDKDTSKWYLERKAKDEFSLKQEIDSNVNAKIEITNEDKELLNNIKKRLDE